MLLQSRGESHDSDKAEVDSLRSTVDELRNELSVCMLIIIIIISTLFLTPRILTTEGKKKIIIINDFCLMSEPFFDSTSECCTGCCQDFHLYVLSRWYCIKTTLLSVPLL